MDYFAPYKLFPGDKTSQASLYYIAVSMGNILMSYIFKFRPVQTFVTKTIYTTCPMVNHPHSLLIALIKRNLHSDIFPRAATLWNKSTQVKFGFIQIIFIFTIKIPLFTEIWEITQSL